MIKDLFTAASHIIGWIPPPPLENISKSDLQKSRLLFFLLMSWISVSQTLNSSEGRSNFNLKEWGWIKKQEKWHTWGGASENKEELELCTHRSQIHIWNSVSAYELSRSARVVFIVSWHVFMRCDHSLFAIKFWITAVLSPNCSSFRFSQIAVQYSKCHTTVCCVPEGGQRGSQSHPHPNTSSILIMELLCVLLHSRPLFPP